MTDMTELSYLETKPVGVLENLLDGGFHVEPSNVFLSKPHSKTIVIAHVHSNTERLV